MRLIHWAVLALSLFAVACSFASAEAPVAPPTPTAPAAAAPEAPAAQARFTLAKPATWRGLTVWPVVDTQAKPTPVGDYQTLSEALKAGTLAVTEVDSGGSVPTLQVHNTGAKTVLMTAGEVVQGGKQDRVLVEDVLIEPAKEPQEVAVNCVEQGRWSAGRTGLSFGYGGKAEVALTQAIQGERDQSATWSKVAELNAKKAVALAPADAAELRPSTGTYMASLGQDEVREQVEAGLAQLRPAFEGQATVVGLVVALDGSLASAEIYGHPRLFAKSRDQALRSAALQVIGDASAVPAKKTVALKEAQDFLDEALVADAPEAAAEVDGKVTRKKAKTDGAAAYKTEGEDGQLLHLSVYAE